MEKKDWEKLHQELEDIYSRFERSYRSLRNRYDMRDRDVCNEEIIHAIRLVMQYKEAYYLLGSHGATTTFEADRSYSIMIDKIRDPKNFHIDMKDFLEHIQAKIKSFDA